MLLSEMFKKQAFFGTVPSTLIDVARAKDKISGGAIGYLKGTGLELGALGGLAGGTALGIKATKGSSNLAVPILSGLLGAAAGGYGGYKLTDLALRKAIGEEKYKDIFDKERERLVKDKKVVT